MAKIWNFDGFGCPDKREIWHGGTKFYVYRGNVSPLRGEKPIFGPLSKNNTGMAALRAGLHAGTNARKSSSETRKLNWAT